MNIWENPSFTKSVSEIPSFNKSQSKLLSQNVFDDEILEPHNFYRAFYIYTSIEICINFCLSAWVWPNARFCHCRRSVGKSTKPVFLLNDKHPAHVSELYNTREIWPCYSNVSLKQEFVIYSTRLGCLSSMLLQWSSSKLWGKVVKLTIDHFFVQTKLHSQCQLYSKKKGCFDQFTEVISPPFPKKENQYRN